MDKLQGFSLWPEWTIAETALSLQTQVGIRAAHISLAAAVCICQTEVPFMKKVISIASFLIVVGFGNLAQASSIASGLPESSYTGSNSYQGVSTAPLFNGGGWNSGNFDIQWV